VYFVCMHIKYSRTHGGAYPVATGAKPEREGRLAEYAPGEDEISRTGLALYSWCHNY
jgi:hypothetical protein